MVHPSGKARLGVIAASAAAGMVVAYLCDPDRGRSRRARLADQTGAAVRRGRRRAERKARYGRGHLVGAVREAAGGGRLTPVDDIAVGQGIKQRFARLDIATSDISIDVVEGTATLRGQLDDDDQIRRVLDEAMKVPGVREVESFLHQPGQPAPNKAASLRATP